MKRFDFNKKYLEISLYILSVIILSIIFGKIIWNIAGFGQSIRDFIHFAQGVMAPFIYGFFIAYFLNATMRYLENTVFKRIGWFGARPRERRVLAVAATYLIYMGCLVWIGSFLVRNIVDNISTLYYKLPTDLQFYQNIFQQYLGPDSNTASALHTFNINLPASYNLSGLTDRLIEWFTGSSSDIVNKVISGPMVILHFVLGLFIAFYMLCDKERYSEGMRKLLYLMLKKRTAERFIVSAVSSNRIIERFIIGKAVNSIILAVMFFFITLILRPPFALLLTLIIGLSNMIPFFGPIVGAVICTLIVLPSSPSMAMFVLLTIFILQQFDSMYLGPKILGDSTGLPPVLVILAIVIGGAVAGVPGMFFGVPVFAIIRNIVSSFFAKKYNQKQIGGQI